MNDPARQNITAEKPKNGLQEQDGTKRDASELVNYVLYSHISYYEAEDYSRFKEWENQTGALKKVSSGASSSLSATILPGPNYRIVDELRPFLPELSCLLTNPANPGVLILFYAKGYAECLEDIAEKRHATEEEAKSHAELRFARSVQGSLQSMFDGCSLKFRLRVVTAWDLYDIFSRIETDYAQNLIQWFIGLEEETIRYDAAKIVEAIIRARMIGSGAPLFRIDQDVLFRRPFGNDLGNASEPALSLGEPLSKCVAAFHERLKNTRMAAFLFSGSYHSDVLGEPGTCDKFDAWVRAFATRCFPALCIVRSAFCEALEVQQAADAKMEEAKKAQDAKDPNVVTKLKEASDAAQRASDKWKAYVYDREVVDAGLMCRFFGIDVNRKSGCLIADADNQDGIGWLGAHPLVSVISGALLCINDSAILDLPPFSNFNLNVMWIDDHLKYCLHRELRHFTTDSITTGSPLIRDARIDSIEVVKGREPIKNLPTYVMGSYLPTVLYGSVVDAWITPGPEECREPVRDEELPSNAERYRQRDDRILKWRPETLDKRRRKEWEGIPQSGPSRGLLPFKLQVVLGRGSPLSPLERRRFKNELLKVALSRITTVRNAWSELHGKHPTFASAWVSGEDEVRTHMKGMTERAAGLVKPGGPIIGKDLTLRALNELVQADLMLLIDDALTYIDMTLNWSKTVQLIRSIEPGTLKTDLFWDSKDRKMASD